MKDLFIFGARGHAKVVADLAGTRGTYRLKGFISDLPDAKGYLRLPLYTPDDFFSKFSPKDTVVILGFGGMGDSKDVREEKAKLLESHGYGFATLIHPQSIVAMDVKIGEGTVVMAGAVINPGTHIGAHVIVNTKSSVDHDCEIADYVHVAPGAVIAGFVTVGEGTWIGMGALLRNTIHVGRNSVVGMGSVVLKDVPDHVVVWGNPARIQRENK